MSQEEVGMLIRDKSRSCLMREHMAITIDDGDDDCGSGIGIIAFFNLRRPLIDH